MPQNLILKFTKNTFSEKLIFAVLSMRKPRIRMPKTPNFDTEINKKYLLGSSPKKIRFWASWLQKAPINRFQNHPKIDENPAPDHFVSILLFPWSPKVVPRCQNRPPGCPKVLKHGCIIASQGVSEVPKRQNRGTKPPKWQPKGAYRGQLANIVAIRKRFNVSQKKFFACVFIARFGTCFFTWIRWQLETNTSNQISMKNCDRLFLHRLPVKVSEGHSGCLGTCKYLQCLR